MGYNILMIWYYKVMKKKMKVTMNTNVIKIAKSTITLRDC